MKKLHSLFSLFAFTSLFFIFFVGCQNIENINSPDQLDKGGASTSYTFSCDPIQISDETVDLVAGQHNPVGTATFHLTPAGNLEISYQLNLDEITQGAVITEVHIDFARVLNNDSKNGGFNANKSGNPQPGQFDINISLTPGQTNWSITVSKANLLQYLNLQAGSNVPNDFYIAAHGVVEWGSEGTCPTLPDGKWRYLASVPGNNYYVENAKLYEDQSGTTLLYDNLNGWCIDRENGAMPGAYVQVNFLCSTENISCFVDKPENIGAVNWLLNNKNVCGTYTMRDIQVTIWKLLDNNTRPFNPYDTAKVNCLYDAAIQHNDFVPGCGEIIGVVMYQVGKDYCNGQSAMQAFLIERTVSCGGSETMWGFDWDFDNNMPLIGASCRFVDQGNWARYFKY